jgi:hypothetical protein
MGHICKNEAIRQQVAEALLGASLSVMNGAPSAMVNVPECSSTDVPLGQCHGALTCMPNSVKKVPNLRMSRQLHTVAQAWREYKNGIPPHAAIKSTEELYGSKWRSSSADTLYYLRRKPLFDTIELCVVQGISDAEAVQVLESMLNMYRSLRSLCDHLKPKLQLYNASKHGRFIDQLHNNVVI